MTIENALQRQGWRLKKTKKWIAVEDGRNEFRKAFGTCRVGKLIGSKFFVTLPDLNSPAQGLILGLGQSVEQIRSTSGRGTEYLGFECSQVPAPMLMAFAEQLRQEVDARMRHEP
jgi:hypothetical protein